MHYQIYIKKLILSLLLFVSLANFGQTSTKFKVVLDAGHGGKDPGTSRGSIKEKDVVLDVVLRLGKMLEQNKDITVVYTRKTDVFIELRERANIANKAKANLFISVHCNGVKNTSAKGTETFVMGMSRTDTNLDIAKKENGVIFLEENYNEKYKGFDPNNPETLLGLRILQEEFLGQSIELASGIEKNFVTKNKRYSRGVKQQPIWVLDATVMPGVLIELGFVSHQEEGNYISSDGGKEEMASSISDAIVSYKNDYFSAAAESSVPQATTNSEVTKTKTTSKNDKNATSKTTYKVQLEAGSKKVETKPANFKGLKKVSYKKVNNLYKYYYGNESDYDSCKKLLEEAKSKGYKTAFIVTFDNK